MTGRKMPPEFNSCNLLDTFFSKLFQIIQDCQEYGVGGAVLLRRSKRPCHRANYILAIPLNHHPPFFLYFLLLSYLVYYKNAVVSPCHLLQLELFKEKVK